VLVGYVLALRAVRMISSSARLFAVVCSAPARILRLNDFVCQTIEL
jgi:hypothetical protein